jgi:predicted naringenin-chalcone synthase
MTRLAVSPLIKPAQKTDAAILGIGTASPPKLSQEQLLSLCADLSCQTPAQRQWLARVFLQSGIKTRSSVLAKSDGEVDALRTFFPVSSDATDRGPTTARRMEAYGRYAPVLAHAAAKRAIDDAILDADAITHLITVSCTGFVAPGLDAALIASLGLSPGVRRLGVGFMGCHGAFNAMAAARDAVLANPKAKVLVCCVELCTLHLAYGSDPGKMVANAIFADGAAAAVIGRQSTSGAAGWTLRDTSSFLIPGTSDAMTWTIGDHGFEMTLSPGVPRLIRDNLGDWCRAWLARHGLEISDITGWAIHPGGPKILAAAANAMELDESDLQYSRKVLSEHGNMSSTTVLFILEQMADSAGGPCVAIGLGPGLMAEGILLDYA